VSAWLDDLPVRNGAGSVTLVEGSSFCVCGADGDISGAGAQGVFHLDTRILSVWELRVDEEAPEPLSALVPDPYRATFLARLPRRTGRTDSNLLVRRDRRLGDGLREDLRLINPSAEPAACMLTVTADADFADLFEVKAGRARARGERRAHAQGERLLLEQHWQGTHWGVVVEAPGASAVSGDGVRYRVVVPARGTWSMSLLVRPVVDGVVAESPFPLDSPLRESAPAVRLRSWQRSTPLATSGSEGLQLTLRRSEEDLGSLRIFDPQDPSVAVVAAGAPWFMALFGRDSLLTAYMAMALDRSLALGTLRTLARHQGQKEDALSEEQPGRVLHEVRLGVPTGLSLGGGGAYYGSVDATPLFVVVLGELARWGAEREDVQALLPSADRALEWVERHGDRNGDGFVEYQRTTDRGLRNQGWKDSWDGVNFADGRVAEPPIALCEVQGYVYAAYRARAELARGMGDERAAGHWTARARALKEQFNERFWLPGRGWYAVALDGDGRPVDACASNMGHCLWSGIIDDERAPSVVERLLSPQMFSGWGVRTLATDMGAYDPVSYHNGSVWPHDTALIVTGLVRYGFLAEAQRVATALLDAADAFGGRLPELFCGFDRSEYPEPVPYPTSCSPQAWASAAPVQLLRALLRLEPDLPARQVAIDPVLPPDLVPLLLDGVRLGGARARIDVSALATTVEGLPPGVRVVTGPAPG
jgi:glycogen debranching enzyme